MTTPEHHAPVVSALAWVAGVRHAAPPSAVVASLVMLGFIAQYARGRFAPPAVQQQVAQGRRRAAP